MCNFVSWIVFEDKEYFILNEDLDTKEGKKLLLPNVVSDLAGHGAILSYYPELKGKGENKECEDFSTSDNFPDSIAKAIKQGKLSRIGICLDVLNEKGEKQYHKITDPAWAEYHKIKDQAWAECNKITDQALAEYNKITDQAFGKIVKQAKYRNNKWK